MQEFAQGRIAAISRILRENQLFNDRDVIFVGGSMASRLATPWSDVDVFLLRHEAAPSANGLHLVPLPHDEVPIDLEVWPMCEVTALLDKLDAVHAECDTDHRAFMRLTEDERDFLHCLASAVPIHNEELLLRLKARVDAALLGRLSLARALVGITNSQTDLLGWLASSDWQSVGTACQRLVDFAALAILGAAGCTHPGGKWLTALLRNHFQDDDVPSRLLGGASTLADRYYDLQVRPRRSEDAQPYAQSCVTFSNLAVVYAQLLDARCPQSAVDRVLSLPPCRSVRPLEQARPVLSCAAQIRFSLGEWHLIHVGREMYQINAAAAAMMLLMDGQCTEQEILDVMSAGFPTADIERMATSLRDVILFLENANLLAE